MISQGGARPNVVVGERILARPSHAPDIAAEHRHFQRIAAACRTFDPEIPTLIMEAAIELCEASAAGIFLRQHDGSGELIATTDHAAASEPPFLALEIGEAVIVAGPCEQLQIPVQSASNIAGTLWIAGSREHRGFDREDLRVATTLAGLAAGVLLWAARKRDIRDRRLVEANLRDTTQRLRRQVENSPLAVVEFTTELAITGWSANAEKMFGWKAEEVLGLRAADFRWIYEEDATHVMELSDTMFSGKATSTVSPNRNYTKDGRVLWCEWYNSALMDESGKLKSVLSFVLDVTERRKAAMELKESQERLDLAQKSGGIGTFESFLETGQVVWTETLERLFGLEPGQFEGRIEDFRRRVHPDDLKHIVSLIRTASAEHRRELEYEFQAILPDGKQRILYTRAVLFYDEATGKAVRLLGINMDVTEQRQAQAERERLLADAEREIARRYEVEYQLRRLNEDLQQFAYSASHDLQEPLRTVSVYSQLLERRYTGRLDAKADRFLKFIGDAANQMEALLRDLLSYTRITTDANQEIAEVDSYAVLKQVLLQLETAIRSGGATVETGQLPRVRIRSAHLHLLLLNVIGNALKYRGEQYPLVHISAESESAFHMFSVRDNGIGIDPQYRNQIFGIFKRLHTREEFPGTGMGLAICQKIVERYGGRIWAEGAPDCGSVFRFTLPKSGAAGNPDAP